MFYLKSIILTFLNTKLLIKYLIQILLTSLNFESIFFHLSRL